MLSFDEKQFFAPAPDPCEKPKFFGQHRPHMSMPERVEDTARRLHETLERLSAFEENIKERYEGMLSTLTQDNVTFKKLVEDGCKNFAATVQAEINLFESDIQATLSLFEESTNGEIAEHLERIKNAEAFMRENLQASLDTLLHEMETSGTLSGVIESDLFVNVKAFGAKGDGVTDDAAAIQRALDALPNGGTVYFPSGRYRTGADITVNSYVTLIGDANTSIIERLPTDSANYAVFAVTGANGIVFRDLSIKGERNAHTGATGEWGMGISLLSVFDCMIDHCNISGCWGDGVYIGSASASMPCDCVTIQHSSIYGNRRNGVSVINAENLVIDNCSIENNGGTAPEYGICFECNNTGESVKNALVTGCRFAGNKYGVGISDSASVYEVSVDGCTFGQNNGVYVCRTQVDDIGGYFNVQNSVFNSKNGIIFDAKTPAGMPVMIDSCKFLCDAIPVRIGDSNLNVDAVLGGIHILNCSFLRWGADYYPVMIRAGQHANASYGEITVDGFIRPVSHSMLYASAPNAGALAVSARTVPEKNMTQNFTLSAAGSIFTSVNVNVASGNKTVTLAESFPYGVDVHFRVTGSNANKLTLHCENGIFAQVDDSTNAIAVEGIYSGVTVRHESPNRWSFRRESNQ